MFLLFFLFFSFAKSPVYADDFVGDNVHNQYFQTTSFNTENFPLNCTEFNCMSYDENIVLGENTTTYLETQTILNLTDFGNMRRIPRVADRVEGPPGTVVDIIYYYLNSTGHHVNISKIAVPFSKNDINQGNLLSLVSFSEKEPAQNTVSTIFNNANLIREGYQKEYEGTGLVLSGEMGTYKIDEMTIKDPIVVDHLDIEEVGEDLKVKSWIQNNSSEYLNNIEYKHGEYSNTFDIPPLQEIVLSYSVKRNEVENSLDLGYYQITNQNTKTECAIQGTNYYNWTQVNAVSVLAFRDGEGWINGAYVQPAQDSFCITRIPYTKYSPHILLEKGKEEILTISNQEVLGVSENLKELPQTSRKSEIEILCFLVVDVVLWYSFIILRRKYESKNTDTRICSKNS